MNINLDIKEDQLVHLDGDLREFFTNLSEDQKMSIIQTYFNKRVRDIEEKYNSFYSSNSDQEWKKLANYLSVGIRDKIQDITAEKLVDSEDFNKIMDEMIKDIQPNLYSIVAGAIGSYAVNHLFADQHILETTVQRSIANHFYDCMSERHK